MDPPSYSFSHPGIPDLYLLIIFPQMDALFAELTVLGFIGLVAFALVKFGVLEVITPPPLFNRLRGGVGVSSSITTTQTNTHHTTDPKKSLKVMLSHLVFLYSSQQVGEAVEVEELPELFETLHMALFATMVILIIEVRRDLFDSQA